METIKNYLDNMFLGIPQTEEMIQLKNDIYENMCEKYQELKEEGKSENESIGVVISEFGNIEELMEAYNMKRTESSPYQEGFPEVTLAEAEAYITVKKRIGLLIGGGVFLCILGVVALIASSLLVRFGDMYVELGFEPEIFGVILMLILVAVAVGMFIYSGTLETPYEYLKSSFYMDEIDRRQIEESKKDFQTMNTIFLVVGVALCVMSPIPLLLSQVFKSSSDVPAVIGVCALLLFISAAVFLFVYAGCTSEAYAKLLETGEYTRKNKHKNKVMEFISSVVWSIATIVFLVFGFLFGKWHPAWLIFPIVGIAMGIVESIVKSISKE